MNKVRRVYVNFESREIVFIRTHPYAKVYPMGNGNVINKINQATSEFTHYTTFTGFSLIDETELKTAV